MTAAGWVVRRAGLVLVLWPVIASAQAVNVEFPAGVAGYDQQFGVTVLTRLRPQYDAPGIRVGSFEIRPNLDQSVSYDSDPLGNSGPGSAISHTAAAVSVGSLWARDSLGASAGIDHYRYLSLPGLDYTDFNVGLSGGYTILDDQLSAAFSHQSFHQLGPTIATTRSTTPVLDQTDTARIGYTLNLPAVSLTPELMASAYRFGNATVAGVPLNQKYLDRNVLAGGVTTRFGTADEVGLVVVLRGIDSQYIGQLPGTPSNDSTSVVLLAGLDYQASGIWRYSLLAGAELRSFAASAYATRVSPVLQGNVIWTPTGVLTVTGTLSRAIADPQSGGNNGYVLTQSSMRLDYELQRNVLLQVHTLVQYAQFLQGGSQIGVNGGGGMTWLLNRSVRLSLDYDYTRQSAAGNGVAQASLTAGSGHAGASSQTLVGLTLHLAL